MRNWIKIIMAFALNVVLLTGCGGGNREKTMTVVVGFEPQARMLRQIGGDSLNVVTLLPPGSDAENYQPTPSTMKAMADADVWFTLGTEGFESSLRKSAESNFPNLMIADCTDWIDKIYGTHEGEDSFDPHLLASVRNSISIARNMTEKLCEFYPERAGGMKERSEKLIGELKKTDKLISDLNISGFKFAIRHPSLSYFARDYGLIQLPLEVEGKESTPRQLAERMTEIRKQTPAVFVIDAKHASERDKDMADELGMMPMVVQLDGDAWIESLERIARKIHDEAHQPE